MDEDGFTATDQAAPRADADDFDDEWADYVPEPLNISEEQRQKAREGLDRYIAEVIEEFGEPTAEEIARAEAWWRPIEEHLNRRTD